MLLYLMIFLLKTLEVSVAVTRLILITKGEKIYGSIISFFEVMLWVFLVATVLDGITEDPIKIVVYAAGFAVGQFVGSLIEIKIGIGTTKIELITLAEDGEKLAKYLREEENVAVTVMDGMGMNHPRKILITYLPRFKIKKAVQIIKEKCENVVITIEDVKPIYGGYRRLRR